MHAPSARPACKPRAQYAARVRLLIVLALLAVSSPARADDPEDVDTSYLYVGGAVPFFWLPLAAGIAAIPLLPAREQPFAFDPFEGGAPASDWEVPSWTLVALGGGTITGMIASGDASRFYHAKGLAQSMATSMFVTTALKYTFSRRRPTWHDKDPSLDSRRSFPSGHATQAFAIGTYAIFYLSGHVLGDASTATQAAVYSGIGLGAIALAAERVIHNRHHVGDVIVGSLIGTISSVAFYRYQQDRYEAVDRGGVLRAPMLSMQFGW